MQPASAQNDDDACTDYNYDDDYDDYDDSADDYDHNTADHNDDCVADHNNNICTCNNNDPAVNNNNKYSRCRSIEDPTKSGSTNQLYRLRLGF